jgi:hypothetical protein
MYGCFMSANRMQGLKVRSSHGLRTKKGRRENCFESVSSHRVLFYQILEFEANQRGVGNRNDTTASVCSKASVVDEKFHLIDAAAVAQQRRSLLCVSIRLGRADMIAANLCCLHSQIA